VEEFLGATKFFRELFLVVLLRHFAAPILESPACLFFLFRYIPITVGEEAVIKIDVFK